MQYPRLTTHHITTYVAVGMIRCVVSMCLKHDEWFINCYFTLAQLHVLLLYSIFQSLTKQFLHNQDISIYCVYTIYISTHKIGYLCIYM